MSTFWKITIPVVIIVIVGVIWYYNSQPSAPLVVQPAPGASQSAVSPQVGAGSGSSSGQATSISSTGTTDSDISSDLNSIDSQINGMNNDSASADQNLSTSTQQ